jgi:two-component system cell cycle sensor histidine kinase/response regulator CckA
VRRLGERTLAAAGYTVLTAGDGAEALAVLAARPGPVELVVTDVIMPTMGGRELARRVGEARPGTRVLFTSGYPGDILTGEGTLPPGAHFIGKPYAADDLTATVRKVLAGRA